MIINLFQLLGFFFIIFLSIIDSFNVFSYNKVITLIQSRNFVYLIFKFDIHSLVIKIAILVNKAVELVKTIPMLGFNNDIVEVPIADPDPTNISVAFNITFFLFKDLYFFL